MGAVRETWSQYDGVYLFIGHGSKNQIADTENLRVCTSKLQAALDAKHGKGRWLAVFGGDPFDADKPDIAHATKALSERGVPLMAIQSDVVVKEWNAPVDGHIDYAYYTTTDRDQDGKTLWGGEDGSGNLVGASKVYLGELGDALDGVVVLGGGPSAVDEIRTAQTKAKEILYAPLAARHPAEGQAFGAVHEVLAKASELQEGSIYSVAGPNARPIAVA